MSKYGSFVPPPCATGDLIQRMLVDRVDERRLSVGMVIGTTESKRHNVVSHGYRHARGEGRLNENTIFEIESITKLFTALLLADMANRGDAGDYEGLIRSRILDPSRQVASESAALQHQGAGSAG